LKLIIRNRAYNASNIAPSLQLIFSLDRKYHKKRLVITENTTKLEKAAATPTFRGEASSGIPKISVVFIKQFPTIFPMAMSKCPFRTKPKLTTSTGTLVPKAMIVEPTVIANIPTLLAMLEAGLVKKKELITTPAAPNNVKNRYQ
jgi:hypothetical protein